MNSGLHTIYDLYQKYPQIEAEHPGVKVIWLGVFNEYQIYTSTKPVRSIDDLKGLRLRVSAEMIDIFKFVGSRTYCDPKSFAWEHEFKEFMKQASQDQFGLKVKLPNGNVASRLIPVQIHDLDADDKKLCESVLGGFLRGIEFIYKEPGVNRPLTPKDSEDKNKD
jgi:hypothetical protein